MPLGKSIRMYSNVFEKVNNHIESGKPTEQNQIPFVREVMRTDHSSGAKSSRTGWISALSQEDVKESSRSCQMLRR